MTNQWNIKCYDRHQNSTEKIQKITSKIENSRNNHKYILAIAMAKLSKRITFMEKNNGDEKSKKPCLSLLAILFTP